MDVTLACEEDQYQDSISSSQLASAAEHLDDHNLGLAPSEVQILCNHFGAGGWFQPKYYYWLQFIKGGGGAEVLH